MNIVWSPLSSSSSRLLAEQGPICAAIDTLQQAVPLGKWYRTQDKRTREQWMVNDRCCSVINSHPQRYYYPYKPAHISRQTVEHKRVYAVPDALRLFRDPFFHLNTPQTKIKTIINADGTMTTKTTTYKYKFIPLARLHENRSYGPILSSLPIVLSG